MSARCGVKRSLMGRLQQAENPRTYEEESINRVSQRTTRDPVHTQQYPFENVRGDTDALREPVQGVVHGRIEFS
jgi:hypothetical protein